MKKNQIIRQAELSSINRDWIDALCRTYTARPGKVMAAALRFSMDHEDAFFDMWKQIEDDPIAFLRQRMLRKAVRFYLQPEQVAWWDKTRTRYPYLTDGKLLDTIVLFARLGGEEFEDCLLRCLLRKI